MISDALLQHVPGCERGERPLEIAPVESGTAHALWRVRTLAGQFVLRAPDPRSAVMSLRDLESECQLQSLAAQQGMAPVIHYSDRSSGLLVMEFVEGRNWLPADFASPARLDVLCQRLAQLHELPVPSLEPLDPVANATRYANELLESDPSDTRRIRGRLDRARDVWQWCQLARRSVRLIHCDVHAGNLRDRQGAAGADALILLDWEYAQVGDPLLDYAALCASHADALPAVSQWLGGRGGPDAGLQARQLPALTAVFCLLGWLWYRAAAVQKPTTAADLQQACALEVRIDAGMQCAAPDTP